MSFTEFYVTGGVGAANINGGGPNLGANDAPVDNPANCTATHVAGGLHTIVDNGVGGFGNTSVDDFICWDTAGAKERGIVTVWTDASNITVQNVTAAAAFTNLANLPMTVGGAWEDIDSGAGPATFMTTSFVNAAGDPPRVNIKNDTTYAENVQLDAAMTLACPCLWEGYTTNPGDGGEAEINGNGQGTQGNGTWDIPTNYDYHRIRNLYIHTNDAGIEAIYADGRHIRIERCKATGLGTGTIWLAGGHSHVFGCYITGGPVGIYIDAADCSVVACRISGTTSYGIHQTTNGAYLSITHCLFDSCGDDDIYSELDTSIIGNCTHFDSGGSGIRFTDLVGEGQPILYNCLYDSCNQYGIEVDAGDKYLLVIENCAFRNNGVGETLNVLDERNCVSLGADPFTNAAADDFSLNANNPGGAECRGDGYPGVLIDATNTGYQDIGALQHDDPAGGGTIRSPIGMTGGMQ